MHDATNENDRTHTPLLGRRTRLLPILLIAAAMLTLLAAAAGPDVSRPAQALEDRLGDELGTLLDDIVDESTAVAAEGGELTLATLRLFIEFNETDADVGIQTLLGGEPYSVLRAYGPNKRKILDVKPRRGLKRQGLSDFFFESAEPSLDDFALEDFFDRFPEGEYEFETTSLEGQEQDGETLLTHDIPAGPVIVSPRDGEVVDADDVVIEWEPVTLTTAYDPPQRPVTIVRYQVIVTCEDPLRVCSIDLPPDATSVSVPPEFLTDSAEYELEIIAVEASDNQTISLLFFETAD